MKIRQLLNIKDCEFKAYIDSFNMYTRDKKNIMISNVYKDIIKNCILNDYSDNELRELINDKLDDNYFITKHEKQNILNTIFVNLNRYNQKKNYDNVRVDIPTIETLREFIEFKTGCKMVYFLEKLVVK